MKLLANISVQRAVVLEMISGNASLYVSLGASPQGRKKEASGTTAPMLLLQRRLDLELMTLRGNPLNLRDPSALLTEGVIVTTDRQAADHLVKYFNSHWQD